MVRFAGMDTTNYPGQPVMDRIWALSNIFWTGMYLDSPAPVPGEVPKTKPLNGHNLMGGIAGHPVGSWMAAWTELHPLGWGLLPIYWGQQEPSNADGPIDLRKFIAVANAEDAAVKAANAGIPSGAVIYLDWEAGGPPSNAGVEYCRTWFGRLAELGYRPGVYCHPPSSTSFRQECPHLFVWNVNLLPTGGVSIDGATVVLDTPSIVATGGEAPDRDAIARQWKFGVTQPPGGPIAGFPNIDLDVATVADPAFPERRNQPAETRSGPVAATAGTSDWLAAYAVRRGKLARITWSPGAASLDADLDGTSSAGWLNPFTATSATRQPVGGGGIVDWFAGLGWEDNESDSTWRIRTWRGAPGGVWQEMVLSGGSEIEPLPGTAIAQRRDGTPEVFALDRNADALAGSRWNEAQQAWTPLDVLMAPNGPAAPFPLRTNGFASLSRTTGLLDLFFVGSDSLVRTSFSTAPGSWSDPFVIGDPTVRVHAMANLAVVSPAPDRIEVVFIGRRDGDAGYHLYATGWSLAQLWASPGTRQIGGPLPLEPMSRIAVSSRNADFVDLFAVDAAGHLHNSFLTVATGSWTTLRPVGGQQVKVADVVSSVCRGPDDVEVLVTARDGSVWATHWDRTMADYQALERITLLDLDSQ